MADKTGLHGGHYPAYEGKICWTFLEVFTRDKYMVTDEAFDSGHGTALDT